MDGDVGWWWGEGMHVCLEMSGGGGVRCSMYGWRCRVVVG
jgi:hypothetical protein